MTTLADLGPGAVTMIGITALQDTLGRALHRLKVAAVVYDETIDRCVFADPQIDAALGELKRAAIAFTRATAVLDLVTTAAREATEAAAAKRSCYHVASSDGPGRNLSTEPCRRCGLYYADDEQVAGGAW